VKITISKENYLKAILEAEAEGETVIAATLARWLNVSAPAVAMAIRRLQRDALITVRKSGEIVLTSAGREIATRLFARHQLIERMLTEIFGMEWYKVHDEAEHLEHAVSEDFERRLIEKLGNSGVCPHGSRMGLESARDRRERGWRPLVEVQPEVRVEVASVFERERGLLEYLDRLAIRPGATLEVLAHNVDQTLTLRVAGKPVHLGMGAAAKVWVKPAQTAAGADRSSNRRA
jgi:DtxR family Mn-dependent transcriptional regulator